MMSCTIFLSNRIKTENCSNGTYFKINRAQDKSKTFDVEKTLRQDRTNDRFSKSNSDADAEQPKF